jgi:hemerythrin-like metal-binding protein
MLTYYALFLLHQQHSLERTMSPKVLRAIGHAAMDAQHLLLMDLVQKIVTTLREGRSDEEFITACVEFKEALATHFAAEETALKDASYSKTNEHKEKHREIINSISTSIEALKLVTSTSTKFSIVNEIEDCLYNHEIVDDCDYSGIAHNIPETYCWDDTLSVGIEWIDSQHKNLFSMAKVLGEYVRAENWKLAQFVYARIIDHIKKHFDDEELHIGHIGADLLSHRRSHLHALVALNDMWDGDHSEILKKVEEFIYHWLRQHIVNDDQADLAGNISEK